LSSDPLVVRTAMLSLPRAGVVHDPHRATDVHVDHDTWQILVALARGPVPATSLWPNLADGEGSRQLVTLAQHGLVHLRFPPGSLARHLLGAVRHGSDRELRMLAALGTRRVAIPPGPLALVAAHCLLAVLRTWAFALIVGCGALFGSVWTMTGSMPDAVLPAVAPVLFITTVATHEAAHLAALRRVTQRPGLGALLIGPFALSVIRPDLSGWALRAVAAAGPIAGVGSGLLACLMLGVDPMCGLAGLLACALHLANLTPHAPDGHELWRRR
jgi:hypothetical protein